MESKQFRKWTDTEEDQLLKEIKEGLTINVISRVHDRSKRAIDIRLLDMSIRMIDNGLTYDEVFYKTKCTEEQIKLRQLQVEKEKEQKLSKNSTQIPFREITAPDHTTLNTILAELRELKALLSLSNLTVLKTECRE